MSSQRPLSEVNPYAPSATIAQPDPFALLGVGYWRHGTLLVLHEDAHLPPICVKTGKPAAGYRPSPIRWTHVLQWPAEHVRFDVPLSARPLYWLGPGRPLVLLLAVATLLISTLTVVGIAVIELEEGTTEATLFAGVWV